MENPSIYDVFERMWQHILVRFNNYVSTEVFSEHLQKMDNPHVVTAEQVGALPITGGTMKDTLTLKGAVLTPGIDYGAGITSYEVAKVVREVCEKYAIPVYDNYALSGIYSTNLSAFTTDNCHWNDTAHEMVGKNLARFMMNTFRYIYGGSDGGEDTHKNKTNHTIAYPRVGIIDFKIENGMVNMYGGTDLLYSVAGDKSVMQFLRTKRTHCMV